MLTYRTLYSISYYKYNTRVVRSYVLYVYILFIVSGNSTMIKLPPLLFIGKLFFVLDITPWLNSSLLINHSIDIYLILRFFTFHLCILLLDTNLCSIITSMVSIVPYIRVCVPYPSHYAFLSWHHYHCIIAIPKSLCLPFMKSLSLPNRRSYLLSH